MIDLASFSPGKRILKLLRAFFLLSVIVLGFSYSSLADASHDFLIDPKLSKIDGSINYSLIGSYKARFDEYSGEIIFDENDLTKSSVWLDVKAKSLKSGFLGLDRAVKSKRLLDVDQFPQIAFKSQRVFKRGDQYFADAVVTLKGVSRKLILPFNISMAQKSKDGRQMIEANGHWVINRKDFHFLWSPVLDHGGIIVGDNITVDWKVLAKAKK